MSNDIRKTPAGNLGFHGERDVHKWLRDQDCSLISNTDIASDGAPSIELANGKKITLPDFTVLSKGKARLVEVKTTLDFSLRMKGRHAGKYQHGVLVSLIDKYMAAERESGMPVFLCVYLFRPWRGFNGIYINQLSTLLAAGTSIGHTYFEKRFFNVEAFWQFDGPESKLPTGTFELPVHTSSRMKSQIPFHGVNAKPEVSLFSEPMFIQSKSERTDLLDMLDNDLTDMPKCPLS